MTIELKRRDQIYYTIISTIVLGGYDQETYDIVFCDKLFIFYVLMC